MAKPGKKRRFRENRRNIDGKLHHEAPFFSISFFYSPHHLPIPASPRFTFHAVKK
ncbi:hypothetical protein GS8_1021 [Geobacillus stearothermophilus]|uniref:Uncharacterized protein n=1 Tax=Geobacillus stearothermophilus TaxID=1422 RepID=A0A150MDD5_GEOSE|nr:hypothetical protein GS8_1021 [Geobacillus stearothermophilus]KYD22408.1 hypothetical protein B4109_1327 [Geobacillus stearothermophilus]KYD33886.1 hypothetical protein B4114_1312 [Geobacillus stearothermophilus]